MPQEWIDAAVSAVFGLVFGGIGGAIVSEWRTRAAEARADERERKRAQRDDLLRMLDDTRRSFHRQQKFLVERRIAGWPDAAMPADIGRYVYPRADIELVGDQAILDDLAMFTVLTLMVRRAGTLTADEWRRFFTLSHQIDAALDAQVDLARSDKALKQRASFHAAHKRAWDWLDEHPDALPRTDLRALFSQEERPDAVA